MKKIRIQMIDQDYPELDGKFGYWTHNEDGYCVIVLDSGVKVFGIEADFIEVK